MEPGVRQYEIPTPQVRLSWKKRIALFFAFGCFTFVFRWVIEGLLHWEHQPMIQALIMPVALGAALGLRFPKWLPRGGSIVVGEDFVEGRTRARWFTFRKRIRREQIKSISENRRGLTIMDRGPFAARMLGFILVPATMPEYQEIKSILSGWAPVQARQ